MSDYNWNFKNQNKKERQININKTDVDTIYSWLDAYEEMSPPPNPLRNATIKRLEDYGPVTKQACQIWTMVDELEQMKYWNKWYLTKNQETDQDKATMEIINQALNPADPRMKKGS